MAKYQKGDYRYRRKDGISKTIIKLITMLFSWLKNLLKGNREGKSFRIQAPSGPNRHERRVEAKRTRTVYSFKGRPGFKLIRRMFRKYGYETVVKLMQGTYKLRSKAIAKTAFYRAMNKTYGKASPSI
jgi:hypothetical protein